MLSPPHQRPYARAPNPMDDHSSQVPHPWGNNGKKLSNAVDELLAPLVIGVNPHPLASPSMIEMPLDSRKPFSLEIKKVRYGHKKSFIKAKKLSITMSLTLKISFLAGPHGGLTKGNRSIM